MHTLVDMSSACCLCQISTIAKTMRVSMGVVWMVSTHTHVRVIQALPEKTVAKVIRIKSFGQTKNILYVFGKFIIIAILFC